MFSDLAFHPVRNAPATAVSLNDTNVSSEITGLLQEITVRVGDPVDQGQVIAKIDCRDYEIAVAKAEAAVKAAGAKFRYDEAQLRKALKLVKANNISAQELDERRSNASISEADIERANAALQGDKNARDRCRIRAPYNGVVIERLASLGDYLTPGSPIFRLLDQEQIEISAKVQEQDLATLKRAKEVEFVGQNKTLPVSLRSILPLMKSELRSYEVRLTFTTDAVSPGSPGRLQWKIPEAHVPADLVVRRDQLGIFIEVDGKARFVPLENAQEGQPAAVELANSVNIIEDGRFSVRNGEPVRVIRPEGDVQETP